MARYQEGDILFSDATVVDGTGTTARYRANVLVRDGVIQSIDQDGHGALADLEEAREKEVRIVDCEGGKWILSPGFIDNHAAKITQGVTTEVIGQDGISYSPVSDESMARIRKQIAGWNGNPTTPADFFDRWRTVEQYLDVLDRSGIATNAAYLVPQGNLRILVKGWDATPATLAEVAAMKEMLHTALRHGAVGMSSGLTYVPGNFADDDELAQLCGVVAEYGGYYCPHTRSYGKGAMEAYGEMIELAKRTGVRLHLTHATLNFGENKGRADEFLAMVDRAMADGVSLSLDTYPYLPGSTTLVAMLPSWVASADDKLAFFSDPAKLADIRHACLITGTDGCHGCVLEWDKIEISGVQTPSLAPLYVGRTLAQIAQETKQEPFDVFIDILKKDDFGTTIIQHVGHEDNVRRIMRHRIHTGGSDGILTSTRPHPRGWGTFPRYLGHYHRDLARGKSRVIYGPQQETDDDAFEDVEPETIFAGGLEEVVSHLTGRAASVIRLRDRGLVREGYRADLVLFDAETVRDAGTFVEPRRSARGIRSVLVNGMFALDEGKPTGARAGRTIRMRPGGAGGFVVS